MAMLQCELKAETLRRAVTVSVILPHDIRRSDGPAKTLYLLHGRPHSHASWTRYTSLETYAEKYNVAVIMPDVNRSYYSDMKYGLDYQTYVSDELPRLCEAMFHISTASRDRYIAGMSMGGYGALKTALLHPESYRGCGALSAVTDIYRNVAENPAGSPKTREFQGIFGHELNIGAEDDIFYLASEAALKPSRPSVYLACGREDSLCPDTVKLHDHLAQLDFDMEYEEWPGIHDWKFWDTAIERLLRYFFDEDM